MYFYMVKMHAHFRILVVSVWFCVVANRSYAFFGVCSFGCTHFFVLRRAENFNIYKTEIKKGRNLIMKKAKRIISILTMLALVMSVFTVIPATSASAADYPYLSFDKFEQTSYVGDCIELKFSYYGAYKNEKIVVNIYDPNGNLVETKEKNKSSYYLADDIEKVYMYWFSDYDLKPGRYKAVANANFYSYYSWNESPRSTTQYIELKERVKTPKFELVEGKKCFKVKYEKVKGATGFKIRYKIKGKWIEKKFKTKKSVTKTIKGLKKGTYKVQIISFNKDNRHSFWSKTKKVKVK